VIDPYVAGTITDEDAGVLVSINRGSFQRACEISVDDLERRGRHGTRGFAYVASLLSGNTAITGTAWF
jgi:hypothetical protein